MVLGYVSSRGHADTSDPDLKRQATLIRRFCGSRGWKLVDLVSDVDQPRAGRVRRPALRYAISRLRERQATCLMVAELRRLCPSVADLEQVLDAIGAANAALVSLAPAIDSRTAAGRATLRALRSVSAWERIRRDEMSSAARASADVSHAIDNELKRRITRMRRAGMTLQAIADVLNEEGVPTPRGGATWRPSSVQAAAGYKRPRLQLW